MALVEVGRVCIKKYGRDAGSRAIVTKVTDKNFVSIISSERPKERKCNIAHLEFLQDKVDVKDQSAVAHTLEITAEKLNKKSK